MPKKSKVVKKTKGRAKPQPLPKSVQALLKYLGGSDVKVGGGARGGQPAQLAPTSINIAVSQQQAQQQQFIRQRVAPKGEVIGRSPLSTVIPQAPVIVQQTPLSSAETERKLQEQTKNAEINHNKLNQKLGLLEASQEQFKRAAIGAYQDVKADINRRLPGDANTLDGRNVASSTAPRPIVEEPQFAGVSFASARKQMGEFEGLEVSEMFRGSIQESRASGLGEHLAGQYIENVSNPEMTAIKRGVGRPKKSEAEKAATKAQAAQRAKEKRQASKMTASEVASTAQLLEQKQPATIAGYTSVPEQGYMLKDKPVTRVITVKKSPAKGAPDMATQIALLTGGGGAVRAPQSQGQSIAELLGASKKK